MTPLQLASQLLEDKYKYATTDIEVEQHLADFIIDWGRLHIPEDALTDHGREDYIHITVKYGLLAQELPPELNEIVQRTKPFVVFLGNVSLFTTNPEFDVVKIDVESPELRALNKAISDAIPHEDSYPEYIPHLTIAYVEKGSCDHLNGEDPFGDETVGREFTAYGMRFSAAGDDTDPKRFETMLLFSKTAHVDRALAMAESKGQRLPNSEVRALVDAWQRQELTKDEMCQRLREGRWPRGMAYWHNRGEFPHLYNRFVREALAKIDEITAQGPVTVDPFGGLGFPVDASQIKFLRRSKGQHADGRTIL